MELGPNDDIGHWTLGYVLFLLGYFDEASAEFAAALRLNPHPYIWEPGWHAMALSATGHREEALAEIAAVVAAEPKNPLGHILRGLVEAFARHYADAAGSFERARELDPDWTWPAASLAGVYDRLGRVDDAISLIEKGPPQWRSAPTIRLWLALSYALGGRIEAAAQFAAFRALAPKYTVAISRAYWIGYFGPEFSDRLIALSREYGIPEK